MITVQIGNSDDKLTQKEWGYFVQETDELVRTCAETIYFSGHSMPDAPWQNAAWCFDLPVGEEDGLQIRLQERLRGLTIIYRQDSIAWTSGESLMLRAT